jgi:hypothetical protein
VEPLRNPLRTPAAGDPLKTQYNTLHENPCFWDPLILASGTFG